MTCVPRQDLNSSASGGRGGRLRTHAAGNKATRPVGSAITGRCRHWRAGGAVGTCVRARNKKHACQKSVAAAAAARRSPFCRHCFSPRGGRRGRKMGGRTSKATSATDGQIGSVRHSAPPPPYLRQRSTKQRRPSAALPQRRRCRMPLGFVPAAHARRRRAGRPMQVSSVRGCRGSPPAGCARSCQRRQRAFSIAKQCSVEEGAAAGARPPVAHAHTLIGGVLLGKTLRGRRREQRRLRRLPPSWVGLHLRWGKGVQASAAKAGSSADGSAACVDRYALNGLASGSKARGHLQAGRSAYSGGLAARQRLLSTATEKSKTK